MIHTYLENQIGEQIFLNPGVQKVHKICHPILEDGRMSNSASHFHEGKEERFFKATTKTLKAFFYSSFCYIPERAGNPTVYNFSTSQWVGHL